MDPASSGQGPPRLVASLANAAIASSIAGICAKSFGRLAARLLNAADIAAGAYHVCGIPSGNARGVTCWGSDLYQPTAVSIALPIGLTVSRLGAGVHAYSTCAIISDGSLQCWSLTTVGLAATPAGATW
jgi:hypothetical protein